MRLASVTIICSVAILLTTTQVLGKGSTKIETSQVPGLTKFLEEQPFHEQAQPVRALLLAWEDKTKDVVDYVCEDVLEPVPNEGVPNGPELLAQFILGSAAFQIVNPSQKGAIQSSQLAGMRSMLKVYQAFIVKSSKGHISRFDDLVQKEADGSLAAYLEPIVTASCKQQ